MISFIVAMGKNRVIGANNSLPWHLPEDLKQFKQITYGHSIVMGRKTFESIGKPLPGRKNIIVTRNQNYRSEGCTVLHSLSEVREYAELEQKEIFVIGGSEIFKKMLPHADKIYATYIAEDFEGDAFFPEFNEADWAHVKKEQGIKNEINPYDYSFNTFVRK